MKAHARTDAARLRQLRAVLGLTQREMAAEFQVAHGAIATWEGGSQRPPGPVRKLLELYEAELGITESTTGLSRLKTSATSRSLALSRVAGTLFAHAITSTIGQMVAHDQQAGAIRARAHLAVARHLADVLGDLKGLAMKVGQTLSTLDFVLPEASRSELASLLSKSRPMAPAIATAIVLHELGEPPGRLFADWSPNPFAAASIGQVHRARLHSDEEVAVKVQYPAIVDTLRSDLRSLGVVEWLNASLFPGQSRGGLLQELRERFLEECDYRIEAANQEEFRRLWAGRPEVSIPKTVPELCTERVLVSHFAEGEDFDTFTRRASQDEKNRAGRVIWTFAYESIFRHHVFPADPHPGNYLFRDGTVVFLDFGCVKRFSPELIGDWRAVIRALLERRFDDVCALGIKIGWIPDPEHFDFPHMIRMSLDMYRPYLREGLFTMTPDYVESTWRLGLIENPNRARSNLPKDWVFVNRLQWGLGCVLARLGTTADFRSLLLDLVYEPDEIRPAPFSASECAMLGLPSFAAIARGSRPVLAARPGEIRHDSGVS